MGSEVLMIHVLEQILLIPVIVSVIGIAFVGVVHVYRFVKFSLRDPSRKIVD